MIPHYLVTVALIWMVAAITPGPNFLLITRYALAGARRRTVFAAAGTITGTLVWGIAGAFGITALFHAAPAAYLAVKLAGGLYILWLGLRILWTLRQDRARTGAAPALPDAVQIAGAQISGETRIDSPAPGRILEAYRTGLLTNLANPKTALFVASVFATALPGRPTLVQGVASVSVMLAISTLWYVIMIRLLTTRRVARGYLAARRKIDAVTGVVFLGFGAKLLSSVRP